MEIDDRSIRDFPTMDGRAREGVVDRSPRPVASVVSWCLGVIGRLKSDSSTEILDYRDVMEFDVRTPKYLPFGWSGVGGGSISDRRNFLSPAYTVCNIH